MRSFLCSRVSYIYITASSSLAHLEGSTPLRKRTPASLTPSPALLNKSRPLSPYLSLSSAGSPSHSFRSLLPLFARDFCFVFAIALENECNYDYDDNRNDDNDDDSGSRRRIALSLGARFISVFGKAQAASSPFFPLRSLAQMRDGGGPGVSARDFRGACQRDTRRPALTRCSAPGSGSAK